MKLNTTRSKTGGLLLALAIFSGMIVTLNAQGPGQGGGQMRMQSMFGQMDADKNGEVSRAEWDAFHAKKFSEMDANADSSVSAAEFKARAMKNKPQMNQ